MVAVLSSNPHQAWEPRRLISLDQARSRTRFVQKLRVFLTGLAVASVATLFGFVGYDAMLDSARAPANMTAEKAVRMVNPRFEGRNAAGEVYLIRADSALRRPDNPDLVDLTEPRFVTIGGAEIASARGVYDAVSGKLSMDQTITIGDGSGSTFTTLGADILLEEGRIVGRTPITGGGPLGFVEAKAYELRDGGKRIVFTQGVRVVIDRPLRNPPKPEPKAAGQ